MRYLLKFVLMCCLPLFLQCATAPSTAKSGLYDARVNAELLSLHISASINADPVITQKINQMISTARRYNSQLNDIHVRPLWDTRTLILSLAGHAAALDVRQPFNTGHSGLDSLNKALPVSEMRKLDRHRYAIRFDRAMNIPALCQHYGQLADAVGAEAELIPGDGNTITLERLSSGWKMTFVKAWGKCAETCAKKHNWIFDFNDELAITGFIESGDDI